MTGQNPGNCRKTTINPLSAPDLPRESGPGWRHRLAGHGVIRLQKPDLRERAMAVACYGGLIGDDLQGLRACCKQPLAEMEGMMLDFCVNGVKHRLDRHQAFEKFLAKSQHERDLEIWVLHDDGSALCALLNQDCGLLMFLRFPEDTGFTSRNAALGMNAEGSETFVLGNGQADTYPKSWTLDRATVFAAINSFAGTGDKPTAIRWHDDSGP